MIVHCEKGDTAMNQVPLKADDGTLYTFHHGKRIPTLTKALAKQYCFKWIHFRRVSNNRWHTGEIRGATTNHLEVLLDGHQDNILVGLHDIDSVYIIE